MPANSGKLGAERIRTAVCALSTDLATKTPYRTGHNEFGSRDAHVRPNGPASPAAKSKVAA
jgi:hypothetical protein